MISEFTNKHTENLVSRLESVGLTRNDSSVFLMLHSKGEAYLGAKIALLTGIPRQYVYNSLEKLQAMGLVEEVRYKTRLKYKALPPSQITKQATKKFLEAEDIEQELRAVSKVGAEQDFEIYVGDAEVMAYERNIVRTLPLNTKQYIIGGSSDIFLQYFGDIREELEKFGSDRGLESYYIACKEEMPWPERAKEAQRAFNYRVLDILPRTVVSTVIRFDTVAMYSMVSPPLVYVIKSKRIAEDYKKHFDMLWDLAGEKTPKAF